MFDDPETIRFMESGCALIVGTVDADGAPHASRAWGLQVLVAGGDEPRLRLLLGTLDDAGLAEIRPGTAVAVTCADVRTLRSLQCKGTVVDRSPGTDDDRARMRRYCDSFFDDIEATDRTPRVLLERLVPDDVVACTVAVQEAFDQTPGPRAGTALGAR